MTKWYLRDPALKNEVPQPSGKPWRVVRFRSHWYWGYRQSLDYVANFRWYWQANLHSFLWHHLGGWSCNTYRRIR